jgi:serine phosphatase RsbU (regulator of sigma subunit)
MPRMKPRELAAPPEPNRPVALVPVLLLAVTGLLLTPAIPMVKQLHVFRLVLAAGAVVLLWLARKRPAGRAAGAFRIAWMLLTAASGNVNPSVGLWFGFVLGFFARRSLAPWVRMQRAALLGLLLLVGLAAVALPQVLPGAGAAAPPGGPGAFFPRLLDNALYGLLQAWLLLAAVRAFAELLRRLIRRASIRTKLVMAFGLFALTPALLAVAFVALAAWMRAGEFRAASLTEELRGHSLARSWLADLRAAPPADAAALAARVLRDRPLLEQLGLLAVALERRAGAWRAVATAGGPDSLLLPVAAPVDDSSRVVSGLALRARSFHWVESAVWPRAGDTLAVMTFEPVDSARIAAFGRQMHCDALLWGSPRDSAGEFHLNVGPSGVLDVSGGEVPGSRPPTLREVGRRSRRVTTQAAADSAVTRLGLVGVGNGIYRGVGRGRGAPQAPIAGSEIPCAVWVGTGWSARSALLLVRVNLWEAVGLRSVGRGDLSTVTLVILYVIGGLFLLMEIVSLVFGSRVAGFITRGVSRLRMATARIREGDFSVRVSVPSEDELGELATSFNQMAAGLEEGQRAVLEREHLRRELELARRIQARLLPAAPPAMARLDVAAANTMSLQVGGDYYDFVPVAGGRIGFCIADVSGKGVGAALLMSNVKASLQASAAVNASAAGVITSVNRLLERSVEPGKFVTLFFGVLDPDTLRMEFVNAGHPAPLLLRADGRMERLEAGGVVLGIDARATYDTGTVTLAPGDLLAMYTDGVNEAQGEDDELYGDERVEVLMRRQRGAAAADVLSELVTEVRAYEGARGPSDDLTAMVIRVTG